MLVVLVLLALLLILPVSTLSYEAPKVVKLPIKEYARLEVEKIWPGQWFYFNKVIYAESKWIHTAKNPRSSAYGLCQTMLSIHKPPLAFMDDPYMQISWCVEYVKGRYQTPQRAWNFWQINKWF